MNLVDLLKQQIGGEVATTLGKMAGANDVDISKVLGAAVPSLLSGLSSLASSKEGAGKVADAIGGMDSSLFGNLAGMLGSSAASQGGSMLGSLMGAGLVNNLSAAISKFTGVNAAIVKSVLGYLTPMVLGAIGKSFAGGKIDASSISRLFSEQKSNITSAIPSGFSLDSIQGFSSLANAASTARPSAPQPSAPSGGGMGKLLMPAIALAAIVGLFVYWNNNAQKAAKEAADQAASAMKETAESAAKLTEKATETASQVVGNTEKMASDAMKSAKDAIGELGSIDLGDLQGQFSSMFEGMTEKLGGIADAAGAEAILPDLKGYATKLDGLSKSITALPAEGKSAIVELVKSQMEKFEPILEKLTGIDGIGEAVLQLIEQIKEKLKAITG